MSDLLDAAFGPEPLGPNEARRLDCDVASYHADPCEEPSLSQSTAAILVNRSPLHAWQQHPRLGGTRRSSGAMDTGTLIHSLVLGKGGEKVCVIDVDSFRTKAAKEERDAALAEGKVVMKAAEYAEAEGVATAIIERLASYGINLDAGEQEVKVEWREGDVLCRGMLDALDVGERTIYDLKTSRSADLHTCQTHILKYGYDIQGAAYRSAVGKLYPELVGRLKFVLLFAELEPPYAVTSLELDPAFRALGESKWQRAVATWAECLRLGQWPGYVRKTTLVTPPFWALMEEEE